MTTSEQEKIIHAINTAIKMELDGKECYLAVSKGSTNEAYPTLSTPGEPRSAAWGL